MSSLFVRAAPSSNPQLFGVARCLDTPCVAPRGACGATFGADRRTDRAPREALHAPCGSSGKAVCVDLALEGDWLRLEGWRWALWVEAWARWRSGLTSLRGARARGDACDRRADVQHAEDARRASRDPCDDAKIVLAPRRRSCARGDASDAAVKLRP